MYVVNGNWILRPRRRDRPADVGDPVEYERAAARVGTPASSSRRRPSTTASFFASRLDCHVIALDMKTGKQIWKEKCRFKEGYPGIIEPLVCERVDDLA